MSDEEELPRIALSSNHFSHDQQVFDVLDWLVAEHEKEADKLFADPRFPELGHVRASFDSQPPTTGWLDVEQAGVDPEYTSWLTDALEETGLVWWEDGEPWAEYQYDPMHLVWVDPEGNFGDVDDLRFVRITPDELHAWNAERSAAEVVAFAVANGLPFEAMAKGWGQPSD